MTHTSEPASAPASAPCAEKATCSQEKTAFQVFLLAIGAAALITYLYRRRSVQPHATPKLAQPAVCALARAWLAIDPDPETRHQVQTWLHQYLSDPRASSRLPEALETANRLRFGTAGVRGPQGAGYDRINALVLVGFAQALTRVYRVAAKPVVIGHDARTNSRKYAVLLADIFIQAGANVFLFSKPVPTPFVAYTVLKKSCALGLCVTASHNPPADNGLKVFHHDGIQMRPRIAKQIERIVPECSRPLKQYALADADLGPVVDPFNGISAAYYEDVAKLSLRRAYNFVTRPVVYTASHGVGYPYILEVFERFGLPPPIPCVEQCEPDPEFPTLPFPNPEEKGALNLAVATARKTGAKLVLANDPDADRLGVAELSDDATVRIFSGDEIAVLFVDYMTTMRSGEDMRQFATVASAVSSKILCSMGRSRGFEFREALTGFKWLSKEAVILEAEGKTVLLTYEEALGYNVTKNFVRDKDGVSAAVVFAELAGFIYESGKTLSDRLAEVKEETGVHMSYNGSLRLSSESPTISSIFESAREAGLPTKVGQAQVNSVRDLTYGTDTAEADGKARLPADSSSQFLTFRCGDQDSASGESPLIIHLRGSGTEPKIKFYSEIRCTREEEQNGKAKAYLRQAVREAINQILKPKKNHLKER